MGTKTVEIKFCDACGKEITGMLVLHTCPCCHKDICVACQEKEDGKSKPKVEKKPSQLPRPKSGKLATIEVIPTQDKAKDSIAQKGYLTIKVPSGNEGSDRYTVEINGCSAEGDTLRSAVNAALEAWGGKIPDNLSPFDKADLHAILELGLGEVK